MATDDELYELLGVSLMDDVPADPRPLDVERLRRLADNAYDRSRPVSIPSTRVTRSPLRYVATAAAVVGAFGIGTLVASGDRQSTGDSAGVVEFEQKITSDGKSAQIVGRRVEIGRIIGISSGDLPILPKGEFYEVWFVASDDTPEHPDRISAGTFHPDLNGRTSVELTAAVNPQKYPTLAITAESADGDPRPSLNEVMRADLTIIG